MTSDPLKATSYQVGKIVNAIRSDSTGNLIFGDVANSNGISLTQIKNNLNKSEYYDIAGTAIALMTAAITASEEYTNEQMGVVSNAIITETTGRINSDSLLQTQIESISTNIISEDVGRIDADLLLQSHITSLSASNAIFIQASPTPSLAVISGGTITVTHPEVENGDIIPIAKINTGSQYDPAIIGRTGSLNIDVKVSYPTSTTTVFTNATSSTNDFIFEILYVP